MGTMSRSRRFAVIGASTVMAVGALLLGAAPASAHSVTPNSCAPDAQDVVTSITHQVFMWDGVTWYKAGPGGTMEATITTSTTISATASVGISPSDLAGATQAIDTTARSSVTTTTTTKAYTHSVPPNEYGNLKYGSWGDFVHWEILYRHSDCTTSIVQTGTGNVPTVELGWYYFSTTH
jgi:hypothetical protein